MLFYSLSLHHIISAQFKVLSATLITFMRIYISGYVNGRVNNGGVSGNVTASNSAATTQLVVSTPIQWEWDVDLHVSARIATDASWVQDMLLHLLTNAKQVSKKRGLYVILACVQLVDCTLQRCASMP
jgi:hypothetical protein